MLRELMLLKKKTKHEDSSKKAKGKDGGWNKSRPLDISDEAY